MIQQTANSTTSNNAKFRVRYTKDANSNERYAIFERTSDNSEIGKVILDLGAIDQNPYLNIKHGEMQTLDLNFYIDKEEKLTLSTCHAFYPIDLNQTHDLPFPYLTETKITNAIKEYDIKRKEAKIVTAVPASTTSTSDNAKFRVRYTKDANSEQRYAIFERISDNSEIGKVILGEPSTYTELEINVEQNQYLIFTSKNNLVFRPDKKNTSLTSKDTKKADLEECITLDAEIAEKHIIDAILKTELDKKDELLKEIETVDANNKKAAEEAQIARQAAENAIQQGATNVEELKIKAAEAETRAKQAEKEKAEKQKQLEASEAKIKQDTEAQQKQAQIKTNVSSLVSKIFPLPEVRKIMSHAQRINTISGADAEFMRNTLTTLFMENFSKEIGEADDKQIDLFANGVMRVLAEVNLAKGESKGGRFILNNRETFGQSMIDLFSSLFAAIRSGSMDPLRNWRDKNPHAVIWDHKQFDKFVNDVKNGSVKTLAPEDAAKAQANLKAVFAPASQLGK